MSHRLHSLNSSLLFSLNSKGTILCLN